MVIFFNLGITIKLFYGWRAVRVTWYPWKILSVTVPISSDKKISSDEDKDVRRGTVSGNANNIVCESTESSYDWDDWDEIFIIFCLTVKLAYLWVKLFCISTKWIYNG